MQQQPISDEDVIVTKFADAIPNQLRTSFMPELGINFATTFQLTLIMMFY